MKINVIEVPSEYSEEKEEKLELSNDGPKVRIF